MHAVGLDEAKGACVYNEREFVAVGACLIVWPLFRIWLLGREIIHHNTKDSFYDYDVLRRGILLICLLVLSTVLLEVLRLSTPLCSVEQFRVAKREIITTTTVTIVGLIQYWIIGRQIREQCLNPEAFRVRARHFACRMHAISPAAWRQLVAARLPRNEANCPPIALPCQARMLEKTRGGVGVRASAGLLSGICRSASLFGSYSSQKENEKPPIGATTGEVLMIKYNEGLTRLRNSSVIHRGRNSSVIQSGRSSSVIQRARDSSVIQGGGESSLLPSALQRARNTSVSQQPLDSRGNSVVSSVAAAHSAAAASRHNSREESGAPAAQDAGPSGQRVGGDSCDAGCHGGVRTKQAVVHGSLTLSELASTSLQPTPPSVPPPANRRIVWWRRRSSGGSLACESVADTPVVGTPRDRALMKAHLAKQLSRVLQSERSCVGDSSKSQSSGALPFARASASDVGSQRESGSVADRRLQTCDCEAHE